MIKTCAFWLLFFCNVYKVNIVIRNRCNLSYFCCRKMQENMKLEAEREYNIAPFRKIEQACLTRVCNCNSMFVNVQIHVYKHNMYVLFQFIH
jgi:hypothetical protein